ncbi:MAG: hypothetical protein LBC87_06865 [Fibromonadaceae bacterium]|jgi:hypothetical protein|nr:hypothetical protein [Fibromonadaceae bacterium]
MLKPIWSKHYVFEQLAGEFSAKDLETMRASAIDFFLKDIEALKNFIMKMETDFQQDNFVFVLKMFVISNNKIFNMAEYMKNQSEQAEMYIKSKHKIRNAEERRVALNEWIEKNAEAYRKYTITKQIYCIDKMSDKIVPVIKQAIEG